MVKRIISGGQTGADRAGLEAGLSLGIPIGGHCPKGYLAEDGQVPQQYGLTPTASADYRERTRLNVRNADATVVFTFGPLTSGSRLTVRTAMSLQRPVLHVDLRSPDSEAKVRAFLATHKPEVLNVAGSRESRAHGIFEAARTVLLHTLT